MLPAGRRRLEHAYLAGASHRTQYARRRPILSAPIEIGSTTIHRIIEQEGPFFEAMQFFPTMTREILDENRGWLQPRFLDAGDQLMLCIQSYIVQDTSSHDHDR
jgi:hypothetical protein